MSELKKLSILGVRSFPPDNDDKQTVFFSTPLTLILGENGCGKTTIIECLKYAITGTQPPGTKSGAFIHDPKIAGKATVLARVKLDFVDACNRACSVQRHISLTQKAAKTEYKNLEGLVTINQTDGTTTSMSSRCMELDREMAELLGVSKPVLSNVIFCHQEESNWPLSEGKLLKQKFDEIFASTKFVKALDNLKKIKAEYAAKIRELEIEEKYLSQTQKRKLEIKKEIEGLKDSLADSLKEIKIVDNDMAPLEAKLSKLNSESERIYKRKSKYESLLASLDYYSKSIEALQKEIGNNILQDSDKELESKIAKFDETLEKIKQAVKQDEIKLTTLTTNKSTLSQREIEIITKKSVLESNIENINGLQENFLAKVETASQRLNIEINVDKSFEEINESFIQTFQSKINEIAVENKSRKENLLNEKKVTVANLDTAKGRLLRKVHEQESFEKQVLNLNRKIAKIEKEAGQADNCHDQLNDLKNNIRNLTKELEKERKEFEEKNFQKQSEDNNSFLKELQHNSRMLKEKYEDSKKLVKKGESLNSYTKNIENLNRNIKLIRNQHSENLIKFFSVDPEDCYSDKILKQSTETFKSINESMDTASKIKQQICTLEVKRKSLKDQLSNKRKELNEKQDFIQEAGIGGKTEAQFDEMIDSLNHNISHLEEEKSILIGGKSRFSTYVGRLEEHNPNCPICLRSFENNYDYLQRTKSSLSKQIEQFPSQIKVKQQEITDRKAELSEYLKYKPYVTEIKQMAQIDIPDLNKQISSLSQEILGLNDELHSLDRLIADKRQNQELINLMTPDMNTLDQNILSIKNYESKIEELKLSDEDMELINSFTKTAGDLEHIRNEIDRVQTLNSDLVSQSNKVQNHISELQSKINQSNSLVIQIESHEKNKLSYMKEIEEAKNEIDIAETAINDLKVEIPIIEREIQNLNDKNHVLDEKIETIQSNYLKEANQYKLLGSEIFQLRDKIDESCLEELNEQLDNLVKSLADIKTKQENCGRKIENLTHKINEDKSSLNNSKFTQRSYSDNLQLRKQLKNTTDLKKEIKALELELGDFAKTDLEKQKKPLMDKISSLRERKNISEGKMHSYQDQLKSKTKELVVEPFKTVGQKYGLIYCELNGCKCAVSDIEKIYKAIDNAVLQFHSAKMQELNQAMGDLWRKIYTGSDIENIQIKVDDEETGTSQNKRKSYSYRVVMMKNGIEMDMRSRCSAGQRVLACIIIRLALAEAFSSHCGILALDEPTTNLDKQNVQSLCDALVGLLQQRVQNNTKFQLIIITHDEEFIKTLGDLGLTDFFLKISRDSRGFSEIDQFQIELLDLSQMN